MSSAGCENIGRRAVARMDEPEISRLELADQSSTSLT